eukprot:g29447.t1
MTAGGAAERCSAIDADLETLIYGPGSHSVPTNVPRHSLFQGSRSRLTIAVTAPLPAGPHWAYHAATNAAATPVDPPGVVIWACCIAATEAQHPDIDTSCRCCPAASAILKASAATTSS